VTGETDMAKPPGRSSAAAKDGRNKRTASLRVSLTFEPALHGIESPFRR
jgi:hypothetical protein